ncbi:uncharacterized protein LOC110092452 isoform X2 [Dendrobium catenatum]|uniref:uncharacterized protein LOC110092452 isoform X2 n=1 Tax=Dendrobium catenatum TaxID=906689 RepID=UPI0010A06D21|nr:uncharacterized protein LOC110092452 isoform X2 [Dendrobium catenatum]
MRNSTRSRDPLLLPKIPDSRDRSSIRYGTSFMRKEFVGVNFITKSGPGFVRNAFVRSLKALKQAFMQSFFNRQDKIYGICRFVGVNFISQKDPTRKEIMIL